MFLRQVELDSACVVIIVERTGLTATPWSTATPHATR